MDENGTKTKTVSEMLKEFADMRRAQDRAEAEARRLGQPLNHVRTQAPSEEAKPVEQAVTMSSPAVTDEEALLTSAEAAKLLGYSEKSFRNSVAMGKVPHYKLFGQNRFKKSELLGLLVRVEPIKVSSTSPESQTPDKYKEA